MIAGAVGMFAAVFGYARATYEGVEPEVAPAPVPAVIPTNTLSPTITPTVETAPRRRVIPFPDAVTRAS